MNCHLDWVEIILFIGTLICIGGVCFGAGMAYAHTKTEGEQ